MNRRLAKELSSIVETVNGIPIRVTYRKRWWWRRKRLFAVEFWTELGGGYHYTNIR